MWLTPRIRNEHTPLREGRRWDPMHEMVPALAEMFNSPERWLDNEIAFVPSLDMEETNDAYILTAEMPGIEPENIDVTVRNGVLELKGEKKEEKESGEKGNSWKERRYGAFHRRIPLEQDINEDEVKGTFKDGVLRIEVPKAQSDVGGKTVPIETAYSS
ncbi:Hsp20/alpha crystallin family protein [Desulfohalobium retbaense]|uniref:Heat shock protein Hsp20 n=1 Tax=Desulfohalobium retbaense (strain ATCC 49708 / DSM 5692 / JCM 16813 / HR100) TaxID=485915 RepID=C8X5D7_DESRD|nr:Hsp20/alpha crystallin family protein [Desulfohalobium retbaense]ACV69634.1 heat shock protein Hsp20 [Desulfohalobium retbaense DSM 5692]